MNDINSICVKFIGGDYSVIKTQMTFDNFLKIFDVHSGSPYICIEQTIINMTHVYSLNYVTIEMPPVVNE